MLFCWIAVFRNAKSLYTCRLSKLHIFPISHIHHLAFVTDHGEYMWLIMGFVHNWLFVSQTKLMKSIQNYWVHSKGSFELGHISLCSHSSHYKACYAIISSGFQEWFQQYALSVGGKCMLVYKWVLLNTSWCGIPEKEMTDSKIPVS